MEINPTNFEKCNGCDQLYRQYYGIPDLDFNWCCNYYNKIIATEEEARGVGVKRSKMCIKENN